MRVAWGWLLRAAFVSLWPRKTRNPRTSAPHSLFLVFFIWEHDFLIEKQTSGIGGLGFRVFRGFRGYLIDACVGGFKIWSIALG